MLLGLGPNHARISLTLEKCRLRGSSAWKCFLTLLFIQIDEAMIGFDVVLLFIGALQAEHGVSYDLPYCSLSMVTP